MSFKWMKSKFDKKKLLESTQLPEPPVQVASVVRAHESILGPVPWTIWFDSGIELVCEAGKDLGRRIPIEYALLVLGRAGSNPQPRNGWLLFAENTVSRRQAVLCWDEERDSFYLYHLHGATNFTSVNRRVGGRLRVGVGSTVEMGHLRFRIERRTTKPVLSSFAQSVLDRINPTDTEVDVKSGFALTIISGERQNDTYLLTRRYHLLHKTSYDSGEGLLLSVPNPTMEHDMLVWSDDAQAYLLVHNASATDPTFVYSSSASQSSDFFAPPSGTGVEVFADCPVTLRDGDIVRMGRMQARLHRNIQPVLEGSVNHILQKGYIEQIPSVDSLIAAAGQAGVETRKPPDLAEEEAAPPARDTSAVREAKAETPSPEFLESDAGTLETTSATVQASTLSSEALPFDPDATLIDEGEEQVETASIFDGIEGIGEQGSGLGARRSGAERLVAPPPTLDAPLEPARQALDAFTLEPAPREVESSREAEPVPAGPALEPAPTLEPASRLSTPDAASTSVHAYELVAVAVPGCAPGTPLQVLEDTRIDVMKRMRVLIGSSDACDLPVPGDRLLAAQHAVIESTDRGLVVAPIDGSLFVNRAICLKQMALKDGDEIRLTRNSVLRLHVVD